MKRRDCGGKVVTETNKQTVEYGPGVQYENRQINNGIFN